MAGSAGWLVSNFALIIIKQCLTSLHHVPHVPPSVMSAKIIRGQMSAGKMRGRRRRAGSSRHKCGALHNVFSFFLLFCFYTGESPIGIFSLLLMSHLDPDC